MVVHDLLYGRFDIPDIFDRLVMVPEVRRLSQVRLLNCLTPSLSSLGEARRFSHTLGVLNLWSKLPRGRWSTAEFNALGAAILLHDIGTPAFGHLFEYQLRELAGWSHETAIRSILWGFSTPEDTAQQIFAGRAAQFRRELKNTRIDLDLVEAIVCGNHPLSKALFGSIDLDNLDNVARMAALLGQNGTGPLACALAEQLQFLADGRILIDQAAGSRLIARWQDLRKAAYDIIVFDGPTVAAQAVMSDAIRSAIQAGHLTVSDWYLSDEELLRRLASVKDFKRDIVLEYLGNLPHLVFAVQIAGSLDDLHVADLASARDVALEVVAEATGHKFARAYVFVDKGAFSKNLSFVDSDGREWRTGEDSRSVVIYGFDRDRRVVSRKTRQEAIEKLLRCLKVAPDRLMRLQIDEVVRDAEPTLNL